MIRSKKLVIMIGTSAILRDESSDYSVLPDRPFYPNEKNEEVQGYQDLELVVTDSVTGRAIPKAMISIDSISRTAVCDNQGKAFLQEVLSGYMTLDVIIWGYKASSIQVFLSGKNRSLLHIKMIRHC